MARPTTKTDLVTQAQDTYQKLIELIDSIPKEAVEGTFQFDVDNEKGAHWKRDKNIRDVIIHLHEWHRLLIEWVQSNKQGIDRQFLEEGYNWKNYGMMNQVFWERHQETSYVDAMRLLDTSHIEVMTLLKTFSNDELFMKNVYPWVGGSTLGSYFVSTTSSHYDWAIKKIRKYKKSL